MDRLRITPAQAREFVDRDWGRLEDSNREHWRQQLREHGPEALLRATSELWQRMRALDPSWPSAAVRAADLEHLIRFKQRIDAASHAFTHRARAR